MVKFILNITFLLIKKVNATNTKSTHDPRSFLTGICRIFNFGHLSKHLIKGNLIFLSLFDNFFRSWNLNRPKNLWNIVKKLSPKVDTFSVNRYSYKKCTKLVLLELNFWNQLIIYPESKGKLLSFEKYLDSSIYLCSEKIMLLLF